MANLYHTDFYAWTQKQAALLKQHHWADLDVPNLVEEIESLGRQERQELRNRLSVLLGHLLTWQYQAANRSNSWRATLREQRTQVRLLLQDNPSLKPYLAEAMEVAYQLGQDLAVREAGLDYAVFPAKCPYAVAQALDEGFFPD